VVGYRGYRSRVNPDAEGLTYPPVPFRVDPERVAAFRAVFGQAAGVPPTFATAAEFMVFPLAIGDPRLGLDFSRAVHGSQAYEHHRLMREGETLFVTLQVESVRHKGGTGFLTLLTQITDGDGALVCTGRSSLVEREQEEAS
jgi:acyl dehydratase